MIEILKFERPKVQQIDKDDRGIPLKAYAVGLVCQPCYACHLLVTRFPLILRP